MKKKQNHPEARIFYADTRFERLARQPSKVSREQALAEAERHVEALTPDFIEWLNGELLELHATFEGIKRDPRDNAAIDRAHQSCAQLRDVGASMGYALVTFVAQNLCDVLDAMKAGAPYDAEVVGCHVDALFLARTETYRTMHPEQLPEMSDGLRRVAEMISIVPDRKQK